MVFKRLRRSLVTKLSLLVTAAVVLAVLAAGINFDLFLRQSFLDGTKLRMQHAFQRLDFSLKEIVDEMGKGVLLASQEEPLIASIELINRYQDKNNYNTILMDEEKKTLAQRLLDRVKYSRNSGMALYDHVEELVAFATRKPGGYELGFVSFADGHAKVFTRLESEQAFVPGALPAEVDMSIKQRKGVAYDALPDRMITTYQRLGRYLVIRSNCKVSTNDNSPHIAHLEFISVVDEVLTDQLSRDMDVRLDLDFFSDDHATAGVLGDREDMQALEVVRLSDQYLGVMRVATLDGPVFASVRIDSRRDNQLVMMQRLRMALILLAIAVGTLWFMLLFFKDSLAQPFQQLMRQIRSIRQGEYAEIPVPATGDEIEEIGQSVNTLALAVAQREQALEQARQDEAYRANHDSLTGLPNRRLFLQRIDQALEAAVHTQGKLALLFLDLDQFKVINDTLGHSVGDGLLCRIAQRLQGKARQDTTLARIGGDEFTLLIDPLPGVDQLAVLAQSYLDLFHAPFMVDEHVINITASLGIALSQIDGNDSDTLFKAADLALYKSKDSGRDTFSFFSAGLLEAFRGRADTVAAIKVALDAGNQFLLYYQPKVSAMTGKVVSAEALLRWRRDDGSFTPPLSFIGLAEESGSIIPLGDWVIEQACGDLARLQRMGVQLGHLSLNVSGVQLRHHDIGAVLRQAIEHHGLNAAQIEVEITESFIANDTQEAIATLQALRAMGIALAIDDFGTGYSSLSYLKKLPFSRLKIDKSFVDGLPGDEDSVAVTRTIIGLAKNFGLAVTAEGVERDDQLAFLRQAQCDEIQGYLFAKPMPLDEFVRYCQSNI